MSTTAIHGTFGNIASFGFPKKRLRAERIMPKNQQVAKIQQYLSNRGADIEKPSKQLRVGISITKPRYQK